MTIRGGRNGSKCGKPVRGCKDRLELVRHRTRTEPIENQLQKTEPGTSSFGTRICSGATAYSISVQAQQHACSSATAQHTTAQQQRQHTTFPQRAANAGIVQGTALPLVLSLFERVGTSTLLYVRDDVYNIEVGVVSQIPTRFIGLKLLPAHTSCQLMEARSTWATTAVCTVAHLFGLHDGRVQSGLAWSVSAAQQQIILRGGRKYLRSAILAGDSYHSCLSTFPQGEQTIFFSAVGPSMGHYISTYDRQQHRPASEHLTHEQ